MDSWTQRKKSVILTASAIAFATLASAEVEEFRVGDLVEWVFDVVGFNFLDSVAAFPDIIMLFGLLLAAYVLWAAVKWKKKRR